MGAGPPLLQSQPWTMLCFLFFVFPPCKRPARSHKASAARTRPARAPPRAPGVRQTHAFRAALPACRPPSRPAYSHGLCHAPCTGLCATSVQETPAAPCVCRPKGHGAASGWGGGGERDAGSVLGSSLAGSRSPRIADSPAGPLPSCPLRLGGACDGSPEADRNSGGWARSRPWGAWGFPRVRRVPG